VLEALGIDSLFAEMTLGLGLALIVGNGLALWKHRRGEKPKGATGSFRKGRAGFLMTVGLLMSTWGALSVFG